MRPTGRSLQAEWTEGLNQLFGPSNRIIRLGLDPKVARAKSLTEVVIEGAEDSIAESREEAEVDVAPTRHFSMVEAVKLGTGVPTADRTCVDVGIRVLEKELERCEAGERRRHVLGQAEKDEGEGAGCHLNRLMDGMLQDPIHAIHALHTVMDGVETPKQAHAMARGAIMRIGKGGLFAITLLCSSCRSVPLDPLNVTLRTGEHICIDRAIEVDVHKERFRGEPWRPTAIDVKLTSGVVSIDHGSQKIAPPDPQDLARWIESYPSSVTAIDSGHLIWVNAASRERKSGSGNPPMVGLAPGNGVWSLVTTPIESESSDSTDLLNFTNLFWAECERSAAHAVHCKREISINRIRATYAFSPEDSEILERDRSIQMDLGRAFVECP